MALMTVLSQHAPNEHFLSDKDQGLVYVRLLPRPSLTATLTSRFIRIAASAGSNAARLALSVV